MLKIILFIFIFGVAVTLPALPLFLDWGVFTVRWAACISLYLSAQFLVAVAVGRAISGPKE